MRKVFSPNLKAPAVVSARRNGTVTDIQHGDRIAILSVRTRICHADPVASSSPNYKIAPDVYNYAGYTGRV